LSLFLVKMVEDIINNLENMKLTTEEEEVIAILDEGCKKEIESCNLSLIGKFLTCKHFNRKAAQSTLREHGDLRMGCKSLKLGLTYFNSNLTQSLSWFGC